MGRKKVPEKCKQEKSVQFVVEYQTQKNRRGMIGSGGGDVNFIWYKGSEGWLRLKCDNKRANNVAFVCAYCHTKSRSTSHSTSGSIRASVHKRDYQLVNDAYKAYARAGDKSTIEHATPIAGKLILPPTSKRIGCVGCCFCNATIDIDFNQNVQLPAEIKLNKEISSDSILRQVEGQIVTRVLQKFQECKEEMIVNYVITGRHQDCQLCARDLKRDPIARFDK